MSASIRSSGRPFMRAVRSALWSVEPEDWTAEAVCASADPEAWFPEKGGSVREAKRVCADCPVRAECLRAAFDQDERFGVWGGLSEHERRRVRKAGQEDEVVASAAAGLPFAPSAA